MASAVSMEMLRFCILLAIVVVVQVRNELKMNALDTLLRSVFRISEDGITEVVMSQSGQDLLVDVPGSTWQIPARPRDTSGSGEASKKRMQHPDAYSGSRIESVIRPDLRESDITSAGASGEIGGNTQSDDRQTLSQSGSNQNSNQKLIRLKREIKQRDKNGKNKKRHQKKPKKSRGLTIKKVYKKVKKLESRVIALKAQSEKTNLCHGTVARFEADPDNDLADVAKLNKRPLQHDSGILGGGVIRPNSGKPYQFWSQSITLDASIYRMTNKSRLHILKPGTYLVYAQLQFLVNGLPTQYSIQMKLPHEDDDNGKVLTQCRTASESNPNVNSTNNKPTCITMAVFDVPDKADIFLIPHDDVQEVVPEPDMTFWGVVRLGYSQHGV